MLRNTHSKPLYLLCTLTKKQGFYYFYTVNQKAVYLAAFVFGIIYLITKKFLKEWKTMN